MKYFYLVFVGLIFSTNLLANPVMDECAGLNEMDCDSSDLCTPEFGSSYCSSGGICTMDYVFKGCRKAPAEEVSSHRNMGSTAPQRCVGVSQEDSSKKMELILGDSSYQANHYVLELVQEETRMGGASYSGYISGLAFPGSGHASWKMDIALGSHAKRTGVLTLVFYNSHDALNGGSGYSESKYDITCD